MDERENQLIIAALGEPELALIALNQWRSGFQDYKDAPHVLSWAAGYIYKNLSQAGIEENYLRGIYRHNWLANNFRFQQTQDILREITDRFKITPLKSFGISVRDYSLGLRPVGDFDFYVESKDLPGVVEILNSHGYQAQLGVSSDELFDKLVGLRGSWNFMNEDKSDLDLHWRIFDHLDFNQNQEIVDKYSNLVSSPNFGQYRELKAEVTTVQIACHHFIDGGPLYSGIFDFHMLYTKSDPVLTFEIAKIVGAVNLVRELLQSIDEALGSDLSTVWSELMSYHPNLSSHVGGKAHTVMPIQDRFIEHQTIRHRWIYKLWLYFGLNPAHERFLLRFLRSFSNPSSYLAVEANDIFSVENASMGLGWHHKYPGQYFRWARHVESRWLARLEKNGKYSVQIVLDEFFWGWKKEIELNLYCAGYFVGIVNHTTSTFEFDIPRGLNGLVEFSLRAESIPPPEQLSIHYNWYRLTAPVTSIRLNRN